jgi:hypothetical protein
MLGQRANSKRYSGTRAKSKERGSRRCGNVPGRDDDVVLARLEAVVDGLDGGLGLQAALGRRRVLEGVLVLEGDAPEMGCEG